jgi:hypothetical protein
MTRHGRACPGHPRRQAVASQGEKPRILSLFLMSGNSYTAWMAGTSPAMTAVGIFGNWYYQRSTGVIKQCETITPSSSRYGSRSPCLIASAAGASGGATVRVPATAHRNSKCRRRLSLQLPHPGDFHFLEFCATLKS